MTRPSSSARRTILLIDDSLTFRSMLSDRLRAEGFRVLVSPSGEAGLDELARCPVDVVVADVNMPGIDGFETCRRIRRMERFAKMPVLLLTSADDLPSRLLGRSAGASEYLVKSADFEHVVSRVCDFVQRTHVAPPAAKGGQVTGARAPADPLHRGGLFGAIVAATGLSRLIAEAAVERACVRAHVDVGTITPSDLERALPEIERSMRMFVPGDALPSRIAAIAVLAKPSRAAGAR